MSALRAKRDLPVIFLTARDHVTDRIHGLELGADDYLVKPFSFTELVLRIRTLLRRGVMRESNIFQIADLQVDVSAPQGNAQGHRHRTDQQGIRTVASAFANGKAKRYRAR